jgi:hypothetical protein
MALCYTYRPSQAKAAAAPLNEAKPAAQMLSQRLVPARRPLSSQPAKPNLSCVDLLTAF